MGRPNRDGQPRRSQGLWSIALQVFGRLEVRHVYRRWLLRKRESRRTEDAAFLEVTACNASIV